jgi:hypothetical protein
MSKLSTPQLKIMLLKEGYSKAKRLSKSKLSDAIIRVFETEQGIVEVKTTLDDTSVISIYKQESKDSMKQILWFNNFEEAFHRLDIDTNYDGVDGIFKEFENLVSKPVDKVGLIENIDGNYEFFITVSGIEFSVHHYYYGERYSVSDSKFVTAHRDLKCLSFDPCHDLDMTDASDCTEFFYPKGTLCHNFYPGYMAFIGLSSDLKYGLSSNCLVESDTFTLKEEISDLFGVNMADESWMDDMSEYKSLKLFKKYDILNVSN